MKILVALLLGCLSISGQASAQQYPFTLPAYSVIGRNIGQSGQANSVTFAELASRMIALGLITNGGVQSITCGAGTAIGAISSLGVPTCTVAATSAVVAPSTTYTQAQVGTVLSRSNSGAAMSDTIPGTGPGVLTVGSKLTVTNTDATGILSINVGAGATFKTAVTSTGFIYLCPGQSATFYSDGANYWVTDLPIRCVFKANTTIFIATTGSATNDGLTVSTPVLDPSFAYNLAKNSFDLAGNTVTFQLAAGTYSRILLSGPLVGLTSGRAVANVIFLGDAATPANVIISDTSATNLAGFATLHLFGGSVAMFNGMRLRSTNNIDLAAFESVAFIQNLDFNLAGGGIHVVSIGGGSDVVVVGNYTVSSGASCHWIAGQGGVVETFIPAGTGTITITITGTPAWTSGFACAQYASTVIITTTLAFSGAATGPRFNATLNGVINTAGGGANFFPGNAVGTTTLGGQYN